MTQDEKRILQTLVDRGEPQSPADFVNGISQRNHRAVQNLVVKGYVETTPVVVHNNTYDFYRPTEKGMATCDVWYKKIWYYVHGDIRSIIVSSVTALITTVIALLLATYSK